MATLENFLKFEAFKPSELVIVLAKMGLSGPPVKLMMNQGHVIEGQIIKATGEVVLLFCPSQDVAYIDLKNIVSVVVYNADQVQKVLTGGQVAYNPGESIPTRLELKRKLLSSSGSAMNVEFAWDSVAQIEEATANLNIRDLANALTDALDEISSDQMGRTAMAKIKSIVVRHAKIPNLKVTAEPPGLTIEIDLSRVLPSQLATQLKNTISSKL